jgi:hypothetical protein
MAQRIDAEFRRSRRQESTHAMRFGYARVLLTILLSVIVGAVTAEGDENASLPSWLAGKIATMQSGPLGPPAQVWRYRYKNKIVYYIPSTQCCDRYSTLYDADGAVLCAPDGGFAGTGDGRCPDFRTQRRDGEIAWPARPRTKSP